MNIKNLKFNEQGLIPVIVQSDETDEVLMLAYMNEEAILKTVSENIAHYYSRSRKSLWKKGETSGNIQKVKSFYYDCDADALLLKVEQTGVACHTGKMSCFFNPIIEEVKTSSNRFFLTSLYATIEERKRQPVEGSYTNYLFDKGLDKILKKVGEETAEVIIASKNNDVKETIYEISDLVYHTLVLMVNQGIQISDIQDELTRRSQK